MIMELQREAPGGIVDFQATYRESLEQARLADQAGFHTVWLTEHHFLPTFSLAPASDQVLAAIAAQTKKIRLGLGVVILPYHHPVHVAERVAILDLISEGRVEFGSGRGGVYEQTGHNIDPRDTRGMWEESLDCVQKIWSTYPEEFSWSGKYWQIPPRVVVPQPIQRPPRFWLACAQKESYDIAADHGMGVLAFVPSPATALQPVITRYRERVTGSETANGRRNNNWASMAFAACSTDGHASRDLVSRALKVFFGPDRPYAAAAAAITNSLIDQWGGEVPDDLKVHMTQSHANASIDALGTGTGTGLTAAARASNAETDHAAIWDRLDPDTLADTGVTIAGTPEQCIESLKLYEASGVDEVMILVQNETVPHEVSMETIRLFGEHVIPHFR